MVATPTPKKNRAKTQQRTRRILERWLQSSTTVRALTQTGPRADDRGPDLPPELAQIVELLIFQIYNLAGTGVEADFSPELYQAISAELQRALDEVFGGIGQFDIDDLGLYSDIRANLYRFSAAKTWQQVEAMKAALFAPDGSLLTYSQFRAKALGIAHEFNVVWLKTEYEAAVASMQMATQWRTFWKQREEYPYLKYVTAGDARVRPEHAAYNGKVYPIESPVWDWLYPPNGWNCRCIVVQVKKAKESERPSMADVDKAFRNNVGKTGQVFPQSHPYFVIPAAGWDSIKRQTGL